MNEPLEAVSAHEGMNGVNRESDPFTIETPPTQNQQHRFSAFDTQLFALNHPSSSPAQAKKALEARLAETDRRIQETSKLGTTLVQQRVSLSNRLREVGTEEEDSRISPELQQKLIEIEREYNEVGRQSAKAFLGPRSDTPGAEGPNASFALDGRNPTSPSKFASQAVDSPSKLNVPRKHRNQASNSDHIEFAAEITTSLLGQVRHLQAVLVERDEALRTANVDKSKLEVEAEGFAQRLKHLDDSEQRYKDENWNLETQLQALHAQHREEANNREQRHQQTLAAVTSEKTSFEQELEDLKQAYRKLAEDQAILRKLHESELAGLRKTVDLGESEKAAMQKKLEDLTSQNEQLAKGLAARLREDAAEADAEVGGQAGDFALELPEREHSPPPSPSKGNQRHSMLESETLKSSLHHAHRMIQSLKSSLHREKSEKLDLRRMLQEARDELELKGVEPHDKRPKSRPQTDRRISGRPGLGATRNSRTDVLLDDSSIDPDWEDDDADIPERLLVPNVLAERPDTSQTRRTDVSDAYQTANETEDAFETANERDTTDNDTFQTGAESMAGESSEELTETESAIPRERTIRSTKTTSVTYSKLGDRRSIQSTASSSEEEEHGPQTPIHSQTQRFRSRLNRKSRMTSSRPGSSAASTGKNSPASFTNGDGEPSQSLFAELENVSGEEVERTPSKESTNTPRSTRSLSRDMSGKRSSGSFRRSMSTQPSTSAFRPNTMVYASDTPPVPRIPMVDTGMMTEPWKPAQEEPNNGMYSSAPAITNRIFGTPPTPLQSKAMTSQTGSRLFSDSTTLSTPPRPVWDQPANVYSGVMPGFYESAVTTPMSVRSNVPQSIDAGDEPLPESSQQRESFGAIEKGPSPPKQETTPLPTLSLSLIQTLETAPEDPDPVALFEAETENPRKSADIATRKSTDTAPGGLLGSVFGWSRRSRAASATPVAADSNCQRADAVSQNVPAEERPLLQPNHTNAAAQCELGIEAPSTEPEQKRQSLYTADQGSQTVLSSRQIDEMLTTKDRPASADGRKMAGAAAMKPLSDIGAVSPPITSRGFEDDTLRVKVPETRHPESVSFVDSLGKSSKRPSSAASARSRTTQYPPLPPDHQEAIAAATQKAPESMGPPLAPASAYPRSSRSRAGSRPRTPSQHGYPSPSSKGGTTPRAARYSVTRSQVSRRSSVTSFASELDERFNIRTDGMSQGMPLGTDPRMIQAITQTMIGEMMWKYTRKAGRVDMSSTRHRRFFWVHPYTRTLYWSDRDPATANRAELKSKSVAIDAVRVVTDDNPMPPGLHRKSLIIVTPGRSVKITAQTSQRHETWFNALSYLLLRTGPNGSTTTNTAADFTDTDADEFRPRYYRPKSRSRVSLTSFKSHNNANRNLRASLSSRGGPPNTSQTHLSQGPLESEDDRPERNRGSIRHHISRSLSRSRGTKPVISAPTAIPDGAEASTSTNPSHHVSLSSRISGYWRQPPSIRNSARSRSSMRAEGGDVRATGAAEPGLLEGGRDITGGGGADSTEDLRRVIEEREREGGLENVRACCDGKYPLGIILPQTRVVKARNDEC
ncbi:MAG: hypothetical protein Q9163_003492 [Psora crenata]